MNSSANETFNLEILYSMVKNLSNDEINKFLDDISSIIKILSSNCGFDDIQIQASDSKFINVGDKFICISRLQGLDVCYCYAINSEEIKVWSYRNIDTTTIQLEKCKILSKIKGTSKPIWLPKSADKDVVAAAYKDEDTDSDVEHAMSNNQNSDPSPNSSIVTSDGHGHYVVYHEAAPPTEPDHLLCKEVIPDPDEMAGSYSASGEPISAKLRRMMIAKRDEEEALLKETQQQEEEATNTAAAQSFEINSIGNSDMNNRGYESINTSLTSTSSSHQAIQIQSSQFVTIQRGETGDPTGFSNIQDAVAAAGTNYTTLTAVENYNMNNIFVETLPPGIDTTNAVLIPDNQLFNFQSDGTVVFCPTSMTGSEQDGINFLPIIDTNSGNSSTQIHFPITGVSGNNIYELISLPNDSGIGNFSSQSLMSLPNGTTAYGLPADAQVVYTIHEEQKQDILSPLGLTMPQSVQTSMIEGDISTISTYCSQIPITTPTATQNQKTIITVVDDFSDLIKTLPSNGGENWNSSAQMENVEHNQVDFGTMEEEPNGENSMTKVENMDTTNPIVSTESNFPNSLVCEPGLVELTSNEEMLVVDEFFEEVKEADTVPPKFPMTTITVTGICNSHGTIDFSQLQQLQTTAANSMPTFPLKLPQKTYPAVTTSNAVNTNGETKKFVKVPKRPVQILPKKSLTQITIPDRAPIPSTGTTATYSDYTSITLRQSMENLKNFSGDASKTFGDVTVTRIVDLKPVKEKEKLKKPKQLTSTIKKKINLPRLPKQSPLIAPVSQGLSAPVKRLSWSNRVGVLNGYPAKVNKETGSLDLIDYNAADHLRRVPLKDLDKPNMVGLKKIPLLHRPKTFARKNAVKQNITPKSYDNYASKIRAKLVVPPTDRDNRKVDQDEANEKVDEAEEEKDGGSSGGEDNLSDVTEYVKPRDELSTCLTCGALATKDKSFTGKKCTSCIETQLGLGSSFEEELSPTTKFKIPKGITIVKTAKRSGEASSSSELVFAKKSTPIKSESPESTGITVVPILQVNSPPSSVNNDSEPPKLIAYNAKPKMKRRMKKKGNQKEYLRKRSFEKVLNTKSQYVKKGSNSSVSESISPGPTSDSDEPSSSKPSTSKEASNPVLETEKKSAEFSWPKYLQETDSKAAPPRFFRQPAFPCKNPFTRGMMLEAVDPQHQSLFCVANVVDVQGYRLRLHLTGYSEAFDFWVNADSYDIFPPGWCDEHNFPLEPPPAVQNFNWHKYLIDEQLVPADREFFSIAKEAVNASLDIQIQIGMKLEAVDIRNISLICVATVSNIINDRILIHFDDWDCVYDYWTDTSSPYIHPVGYCKKNGFELTPPKNHKGTFVWDDYLKETNSIAVPVQFIRPLPPIGFKKGMKLECVDKRNPFLIRVSTIADVEDHQLTIHFDGWSSDYDYKVYECSGDIHPTGWCAATGHPLQTPPNPDERWSGACSVFGCLGLGHIKGNKFLTHNSEVNCPYSQSNYKKDWNELLPDRFVSYKKSMLLTQHHEHYNASRRSSIESQPQTTFTKAVKLRAEKRKSEAAAIDEAQKRKYVKRKSESDLGLMTNRDTAESEDEPPKLINESQVQVPPKRSVGRPRKSITISSGNQNADNNVQQGTAQVVSLQEVAKRLIIPNIESTITRIASPSPPLAAEGSVVVKKINWEDIIDSVVKDQLAKKPQEIGEMPDFSLPSCTTMTLIPTPGTSTSTTAYSSETFQSKPQDELVVFPPVVISQSSNDSWNEESASGIRSASPVPSESDSDLPLNYVQNVKTLQDIVGTLDHSTVSKWKTVDVVEFVKRIPGCLEASALFDEHKIDGEAFMLMTATDFIDIMGLKMGPCLKLSNGIRLIQKNGSTVPLPQF